MSQDKLNTLHSYVTCVVRRGNCDPGITTLSFFVDVRHIISGNYSIRFAPANRDCSIGLKHICIFQL